MNKSYALGILTAIGLAGAAIAQEPATPRNPTPSTNPAEGTAADRTQPGETRTREDARDPSTDPRPSTSQAEGTAADRTQPGDTSTISGKAARSPAAAASSAQQLVGASVVTKSDTPLGEVTDVVFDAKQQPAFVIISAAGESAAVPYAAASSMMSGDKVVIDQSRLQSAPKVKQGEWRDQSSKKWQTDAKRYWERG
ncbi:MAG: PRC-barrel domain-containing protein [Steroidobacter sp.]